MISSDIGHELVKAGLLLSLFGGCQKFMTDCNRIPLRGDAHVLVVGDPGLGKSQVRGLVGMELEGMFQRDNVCRVTLRSITLSIDLTMLACMHADASSRHERCTPRRLRVR